MVSLILGMTARTACNVKLASNFFRAQRLQMPTTPLRKVYLNLARRSENFPLKSTLSTSVRRPHKSQKVIGSAAISPTPAAATAMQPGFWERLGLLTQCLRWYSKSNSQRPYLTQFLSSLVIFCTGDLAAQCFGGEEYDYKRTLRVLAIT